MNEKTEDLNLAAVENKAVKNRVAGTQDTRSKKTRAWEARHSVKLLNRILVNLGIAPDQYALLTCLYGLSLGNKTVIATHQTILENYNRKYICPAFYKDGSKEKNKGLTYIARKIHGCRKTFEALGLSRLFSYKHGEEGLASVFTVELFEVVDQLLNEATEYHDSQESGRTNITKTLDDMADKYVAGLEYVACETKEQLVKHLPVNRNKIALGHVASRRKDLFEQGDERNLAALQYQVLLELAQINTDRKILRDSMRSVTDLSDVSNCTLNVLHGQAVTHIQMPDSVEQSQSISSEVEGYNCVPYSGLQDIANTDFFLESELKNTDLSLDELSDRIAENSLVARTFIDCFPAQSIERRSPYSVTWLDSEKPVDDQLFKFRKYGSAEELNRNLTSILWSQFDESLPKLCITMRVYPEKNYYYLHLDDLTEQDVDRFRDLAFVAFKTTSEKFKAECYQAIICVRGGNKDNMRAIRRYLGSDDRASGSYRIPGTFNNKPKYRSATPLVELYSANQNKVVSVDEVYAALGLELKVENLVCDPQIEISATPVQRKIPSSGGARRKPVYQHSLDKANVKTDGTKDRSQADRLFQVYALSIGYSVEETADLLMQQSERAIQRGFEFILSETKGAQKAIEARQAATAVAGN